MNFSFRVPIPINISYILALDLLVGSGIIFDAQGRRVISFP